MNTMAFIWFPPKSLQVESQQVKLRETDLPPLLCVVLGVVADGIPRVRDVPDSPFVVGDSVEDSELYLR